MKILWTVQDVVAGQKYQKPGAREVWMIGYDPSKDSDSNVVSISLDDGMVTSAMSRGSLADQLTKGGYVPLDILQAHPTLFVS